MYCLFSTQTCLLDSGGYAIAVKKRERNLRAYFFFCLTRFERIRKGLLMGKEEGIRERSIVMKAFCHFLKCLFSRLAEFLEPPL